MIDNYIKVYTQSHDDRERFTCGAGIHPRSSLSTITRARMQRVRASLSEELEREPIRKPNSVTSWCFSFDSRDTRSVESARMLAHEKMTELVACGFKPRMTLFAPVKGLHLGGLVGEGVALESEAA